MTAPVSFREKVRFFSLAPRAPSRQAILLCCTTGLFNEVLECDPRLEESTWGGASSLR
jgi:hypothetical protein